MSLDIDYDDDSDAESISINGTEYMICGHVQYYAICNGPLLNDSLSSVDILHKAGVASIIDRHSAFAWSEFVAVLDDIDKAMLLIVSKNTIGKRQSLNRVVENIPIMPNNLYTQDAIIEFATSVASAAKSRGIKIPSQPSRRFKPHDVITDAEHIERMYMHFARWMADVQEAAEYTLSRIMK